MQKITFIGNLCSDPDMRSTPNGVTVTTFTVAVDRRFKDSKGEKVTDFFRVVCWRQLGEICAKFLSKGKKIAVIGELQARTYEDKKGTTRMSLDVQADEVEFLSSRTDADNQEEPKGKFDTSGFTDIQSDDIEF